MRISPEVRKFGGKRYFLACAKPFETKKRVLESKKLQRAMGRKTRIVKVKKGYNIYFR